MRVPFSRRQTRDERPITRFCDDRAMMTQQLEVSILAAPLAAIDRGVLSEAWYSALRLVRQTAPSSAKGAPLRLPASVRVRAHAQHVQHSTRDAHVAILRRHVGADKPTTTRRYEVKGNAQRRRRALAERIEHAFARPNPHPKRATFSMGRGNARVHIVLQTKGERTTLLAICRPEMRAVVARALTEARFALGSRGIDFELRASNVLRCS